ncbi:sarcosine dehydrogenase, mitochondrial [Camelus ferus]|nr:sarcosine dehydrogenase, mitochondrial [Camelus ferus]
MPNVRDHDASVYLRLQGDALSVGGYEANPIFWEEVSDKFAFGLFDLDWDVFAQHTEGAIRRVPVLERTGVKSTVCGPESFTPDHKPLMGEAPELRGFYLGCGFNSAVALGPWLALPEAVTGPSIHDRRFHHSLTDHSRWIRERSHESYAKNYSVVFPHDEPLAGRNMRRGPLHEIKKECLACRGAAAVFDMSYFGKFYLVGPDARMAADWLFSADVSRPPGTTVYTCMLTHQGGTESDLTVSRLAPGPQASPLAPAFEGDGYYLAVGGAVAQHNWSHITTVLQDREFRCQLIDSSEDLGLISVQGPARRNRGRESSRWRPADQMSVPPTAGLEAGEAPGGDGVPEPRPKRQVLGWEPIVRQGGLLSPSVCRACARGYVEEGTSSPPASLGSWEPGGGLGQLHPTVNSPKGPTERGRVSDKTRSPGPLMASRRETLGAALLAPSSNGLRSPVSVSSDLLQSPVPLVRAMRLSFVGELGWELHVPRLSCLPVYRAVMAAGAKHGLVNAGYRAIDSLSIEKGPGMVLGSLTLAAGAGLCPASAPGLMAQTCDADGRGLAQGAHPGDFLQSGRTPPRVAQVAEFLGWGGYRHWHADLRPDDSPLEAGLAFTCKLKSAIPFLGREALERQQAEGLRRRLVCFTVDEKVPMFGLEAIWRDGQVVGHVRRADFGFTVGKTLAYGYIRDPSGGPVSLDFVKSGDYALERMGVTYPAQAHLKSPFDPDSRRVKGIY